MTEPTRPAGAATRPPQRPARPDADTETPEGTTGRQAPAQPVDTRRRRALVHNAITEALGAAGDWVPLSVRAAATRAALAEVDAWHTGGDA